VVQFIGYIINIIITMTIKLPPFHITRIN
jgi:hypothetical protein